MDKQKEIEKMAYSICTLPQVSEYITSCSYCGLTGDCLRQKHAKEFINAGYGDTKAAVKEFASKVKELTHGFENISQSTDDCLCEKIDELIEEEYGDEV